MDFLSCGNRIDNNKIVGGQVMKTLSPIIAIAVLLTIANAQEPGIINVETSFNGVVLKSIFTIDTILVETRYVERDSIIEITKEYEIIRNKIQWYPYISSDIVEPIEPIFNDWIFTTYSTDHMPPPNFMDTGKILIGKFSITQFKNGKLP
jgi:hypothetical protein